jgi:DNA-directed DNA polymerase III PolC
MYLNCKTYFSFKYGTFSTKELVQTAVDKGLTALALTNVNSTCDTWEFVKLCREAGIKPITGVEVRNGDELLYILIAANNKGLAWTHRFLSLHICDSIPFPTEYVFFNEPNDGFVIYPFGAKSLDTLLSNERIGVKPSETTKLFKLDKQYADKFVVRQPVTVQDKKYHGLHRILRAIHNNIVGTKLEPSMLCEEDETFLSPNEILNKFKQHSFIVINTLQLMQSCNIEMDFHVDKNKRVYGGSEQDDKQLLEKLATSGLHNRYGKKNKVAADRLQHELKIINDMGFNSYFLINYDIIRYAQSRGFYYVGRGSGANSIVAYCLRITDVDPIELNLYFARFLNEYRTSPPDFDIDFAHTDRDEIMDYIFKRYGREHVALLGSFPTFKSDSIVREIGKVFGLPNEDIERLQKSGTPSDKIGRQILHYGKLLRGFPSYPSLHPCGMIITDKPITEYGTLFMPPKGFPGLQMDMFTAEDVGLNKFDILSQRGLSHIRTALEVIKDNGGPAIDIHDIPRFKNDAKVAAQIRKADTIGCFYIESPAMRGLLKKLQCDDYMTLVAASSIIRPGVAQSGMMRQYIERYQDPSKVKYLHPVFEELLSETFGVMVFQEDVIKIAHHFAGLNHGQSDILRRAMSGKYRSDNEFRMIKEQFMEGAKKLGHPDSLSEEVWRQMQSFGGYSFNKAHSASFAVESYQSLYLKTYFPKEFLVGVINNFGGFYRTELYFLQLIKAGANVHPPCINNSDLYTNISGNDVHAGFVHIKHLQSELVERILDERKLNGAYLHLQDFIRRINCGIEQLTMLVQIGAFRFTGKTKKELLWEANYLQKKIKPEGTGIQNLFIDKPMELELPKLTDHPLDDRYDELEILGYPLVNPFEIVDADPKNFVAADDIGNHKGKVIDILGYYIAHKHVITKNHQDMYFGTFVDSELNWIDTVHFPDSAKRYPLDKAGFYKMTGKVVDDFGVYSVEVQPVKKVSYKLRTYANL